MSRHRGAFWGFQMKRELARGPVETPPTVSTPKARINDDLPAIRMTKPRAIHVYRYEYPEGRPTDWVRVLIWEADTDVEALRVAIAQKYKCRVEKLGEKRPFDNGGPMKVNGIVRHLIDSLGILCDSGKPINGRYDVEVGDLLALVPSWRAELCPRCLALVPYAE